MLRTVVAASVAVAAFPAYTARSATVRAAGAKLRSLARGPLSAEVTVRTLRGNTPVTTKVTVTR
jgi:hypothetical protein